MGGVIRIQRKTGSSMVYRIYVEKKQEHAFEARALFSELYDLLGIKTLERVRVINRYDAENMEASLFDTAVKNVFSEPAVDTVSEQLETEGAYIFAVEYLPGQFDQRADSAAQCISIYPYRPYGNKGAVRRSR